MFSSKRGRASFFAAFVVFAGCGAAPAAAPEAPFWKADMDACERGDDAICVALLREAVGPFPFAYDVAPGKRAGEIACGRDVARACTLLALLLPEGEPRAELTRKVCRLHDLDACATLYRAYLTGDRDLGIERDVRAGLPWALEACKLGERVYCWKPLWALKDGIIEAEGDARDDILAQALCEKRGPECDATLGRVYSGRENDRKWFVDLDRAHLLLGRACDASYWPACDTAATLVRLGMGVPEDLPRALSLWKRGCDAAHAPSCFALAGGHLVAGASYDAKRAVAEFRASCGSDARCLGGAARVLAFKKERRVALELFEESCAGGASFACSDAGRVRLLLGQRAGTHLADLIDACNGEQEAACLALAHAYATGLADRRDPKRAAAYKKRASDVSLSTKYWRSFDAGLSGKGNTFDKVNAGASIITAAPMFIMGVFAVLPDAWDFSEVHYSDP